MTKHTYRCREHNRHVVVITSTPASLLSVTSLWRGWANICVLVPPGLSPTLQHLLITITFNVRESQIYMGNKHCYDKTYF